MKKVVGGNLPVDVWSRFMRDALQGVTPTGLPLGDWRGDDASTPGAPPAPVGAPMAINKLAAPLRPFAALSSRPPISPTAARAPSPHEKNLFEKLLGQL